MPTSQPPNQPALNLPPPKRAWRAPPVKRPFAATNALCPECRAPVYFRRGPSGGGNYFDTPSRPWTKHPCTNKEKPYTHIGRNGNPKLRNRKSTLERNGWIPFVVCNIETPLGATIVHGVALDSDTVHHIGFLRAFAPDQNEQSYIRPVPDQSDEVEFNCVPLGAQDARSYVGYGDCRNALDLILRHDGTLPSPAETAASTGAPNGQP